MRVRSNRFAGAWALLLAIVLLVTCTHMADAAVTWQGLWTESDNRTITLLWETGTEFDNLGFYVLRAERESGPFARRDGSWTLAQGGMIGSSYSWTDREELRSGHSYYYLIESISSSNVSERHGQNGKPVCARLGGESCKTAASATPTRRTGATATSRNATPRPTQTPRPEPTIDGPTPVRVPTGAGGDDYGGSRSNPARTAAPSRTPRPGASGSNDAATSRPPESSSETRGRLVTAPARASSDGTPMPAEGQLAARAGAGTSVAGESDTGDAADRARMAASTAPGSSGEAPDGSSMGQRDDDGSLGAADNPPDSQQSDAEQRDKTDVRQQDSPSGVAEQGADEANPWMLLLMGLLAVGLGLRVWTLARTR